MKLNNFLWGVVLLGLCGIIGLNALGITNIDLFFDGWWTLIIIIPSFIDLFNENSGKTGNLVGLLIGVFLLLECREILSYNLVLRIAFPILFLVVFLSVLFKDILKNKIKKKIKLLNTKNGGANEYSAILSGKNINFSGNAFSGCNLTAIFGGLKYDLTGEQFDGEVAIQATAIFGKISIIVPVDAVVEVTTFPLFGGVSKKRKYMLIKNSKKTIYINATCMFGGVEIK